MLPIRSILALVAFLALGDAAVTFSPSLLALLPGTRKEVILDMEPVLGQVLQNPSINSFTGDAKRNQIIRLLKERTRVSQTPVLNALSSLGITDVKTFWVANRIVVRNADIGALQALSRVPGLNFVVREPFQAKIYPIEVKEEVQFPPEHERTKRQAADGLQWGVSKINANQVWAAGNTGKGVVVGIIDTGVNVNHIALTANYKNDKSSWLDAFGQYPDKPYDGNGHGTHCTGTICGTTNGIGVAPGAQWIACRGLDDEGSGNETTLMACGEFMSCPSGNSSGDCSGFPNVVSNSWGGLIGAQDWFNQVISTWRSLNIVPVFALGNSGPFCMTAGSPGDQDNLISVGATDIKDKVARFSSRGPSLLTGKLKPEVSAPGKDIISATHDKNDGYRKLSGTSMACPHVAGATALLLSANPKADFDTIKNTLQNSAVKPALGFQDSGNVCTVPAKYPNNGYGYGRIDAQAGVAALPKI